MQYSFPVQFQHSTQYLPGIHSNPLVWQLSFLLYNLRQISLGILHNHHHFFFGLEIVLDLNDILVLRFCEQVCLCFKVSDVALGAASFVNDFEG